MSEPAAFDDVHWIRTTAELQALVDGLGAGPLAVDTEADSFHRYRERICLVQLSHGGRDFLVDPLAAVDLRVLAAPLGDPSRTKILHGADYDLRLLQRDHEVGVRGLFDTMIAARLTGERAFGLAALLRVHLGVDLDKRFQRADWAERPLPREMQRYAVLDTRYLGDLAAVLERRLVELGREGWAREEFERLEQVRWREVDPTEPAHERFRGASRMAPRQLRVLIALLAFRDGEARRRDVPPFRVMRDEVLFDLATTTPVDPGTLENVRGLPRAFARGRRADALLATLREALAVPEAELPAPVAPRRRPRPDPEIEAEVRRLCRERDRVAERLDLEPAVVAPRHVLEAVALRKRSGEDPAGAPGLRRWQASLLAPVL